MTATLTRQSTVTIPLAEALKGFAAVEPHMGSDKTTPVIASVMVTPEGQLVATDRYSVARFQLEEARPELGEHDLIIPAEAVAWIKKIVIKSLRRGLNPESYSLQIEHVGETSLGRPDALKLSIVYLDKAERSQEFDAITGNYPPVNRLFEHGNKLGGEEFSFKLMNITKIAASMKALDGAEGSARWSFFTADSGKPAPCLIEMGALSMLIQPNLILR